ncbi:hypothetical protein D3C87_1690180 [compost metagenome]
MRARVLAQQVVQARRAVTVGVDGTRHAQRAPGRVGARGIEQVAGGVEREGFAAQAAGDFEQSAHGVVAIGQRAAPAVLDRFQLAGGVVAIAPLQQALRASGIGNTRHHSWRARQSVHA